MLRNYQRSNSSNSLFRYGAPRTPRRILLDRAREDNHIRITLDNYEYRPHFNPNAFHNDGNHELTTNWVRVNDLRRGSLNERIENLFIEIDLLGKTARADSAMDKSSSSRDDGEGNAVRLALWNNPGDGIYGMFARSKRLVNRVEQLLEDEAYHYHSKMVLKDAKVGGAWAWHQDYG